MKFKILGTVILVLLILLVAWNSCFVVGDDEQVVIVRNMANQLSAIDSAGVYFRFPFFTHLQRFEKRMLDWRCADILMPTRDNKYISVSAFACWRIADPVSFYLSVGDTATGKARLNDLLEGALANEIARHTLSEIIRTTERPLPPTAIRQVLKVPATRNLPSRAGRAQMLSAVLQNIRLGLDSLKLGIEVVDFDLGRVNYVQEIK